jgi:hypothetical protein
MGFGRWDTLGLSRCYSAAQVCPKCSGVGREATTTCRARLKRFRAPVTERASTAPIDAKGHDHDRLLETCDSWGDQKIMQTGYGKQVIQSLKWCLRLEQRKRNLRSAGCFCRR